MPNLLSDRAAFKNHVRSGVPSAELAELYYCSIRSAQEHAKIVRDRDEQVRLNTPVVHMVNIPVEQQGTIKIVDGWIDPVVLISTTKKWTVPTSVQPLANEFPYKVWDRVGLISDLHIPFHHAPTVEAWLTKCDEQKIRKAIVVGDTMDGGHWHPRRGKDQHHGRTWQDDLEIARSIYKIFSECFEEVLVLMGNHDDWHQKHMRGQIKAEYYFGHMFAELPSIKFTDFQQAQVTSGSKQFRLLHGASYSASSPLSIAKKYAAKFEMGVVMGHQHHAEDGWSQSGKHQVVCMGGAIDQERMSYIHQEPTPNVVQSRSFAVLQDGWIEHFKQQN